MRREIPSPRKPCRKSRTNPAHTAKNPVASAAVFGTPELGSMERDGGKAAVTSRVTGQVELADGTVVRLGALLLQDEKSKQWGVVELTLPPFLP